MLYTNVSFVVFVVVFRIFDCYKVQTNKKYPTCTHFIFTVAKKHEGKKDYRVIDIGMKEIRQKKLMRIEQSEKKRRK